MPSLFEPHHPDSIAFPEQHRLVAQFQENIRGCVIHATLECGTISHDNPNLIGWPV
jgi:hypothetical protein